MTCTLDRRHIRGHEPPVGSAWKPKDCGALHRSLRALQRCIKHRPPPWEALPWSAATAPVDPGCDLRCRAEELLCGTVQATPALVHKGGDCLAIALFFVGTPMCRSSAICIRCLRCIPRSARMPDCHVEQSLPQFPRTESAHVEPSLFLRGGEGRDEKLPTRANAGLVQNIAPRICKTIVAKICERTTWTNCSMIVLSIQRFPTDLAFACVVILTEPYAVRSKRPD